MYKVSILIPIYNVEKYLHQCLGSVINQTLEDIEIICINDGSTDNSPAIINEFASKDTRIKVINKPNTGYGHSMNQGLKMAQGKYVGIVESDDFVDLNMFESLFKAAETSKADIIKSNYFEQVKNNSKFIEVFKNEEYGKIFSPKIHQNIFQSPTSIWSAIYRREFLLNNDIYFNETPGASYQDVAFVFKSLACAESILPIKNAFLHYRKDNPDSSVKSKEKVFCIFDEFEEIDKFLNKRSELKEVYKYVIPPLKYKHYLFNYKRMADKFKFIFSERFFKDFEQINASKYLNKDYWRQDKWQEIQLLLNNNKEYFYRQYENIQRNCAYMNAFLSKIKSFDNIYIYGAGKFASNTIFKLYQHSINIKGIVVSSMKNNPDRLMDIQVNALSNVNINKECDVILIALKEESQYDIFYQLQDADYQNIILMTQELRGALSY